MLTNWQSLVLVLVGSHTVLLVVLVLVPRGYSCRARLENTPACAVLQLLPHMNDTTVKYSKTKCVNDAVARGSVARSGALHTSTAAAPMCGGEGSASPWESTRWAEEGKLEQEDLP